MEQFSSSLQSSQERKKKVSIENLVKQQETIIDPPTYEGGPIVKRLHIESEAFLEAFESGALSEEEIFVNVLNQRSPVGPLDERLKEEREYIESYVKTGIDASPHSEENLKKLLAMKEANAKYIPLSDNIHFTISSPNPKRLTEVFAKWMDAHKSSVRIGNNYNTFDGGSEEMLNSLSVGDPKLNLDMANVDLSLDYPSLSHCASLTPLVRNEQSDICTLTMSFHVHTDHGPKNTVGCIPDLMSLVRLASEFKKKGLAVELVPGEWIDMSEKGDDGESKRDVYKQYVIN